MPSTQRALWLLLADIHFKHHDLERINRTASWIVSLGAQRRVSRVVICGDLFTTRSSQPTHVLSACYRFLYALIHEACIPNVNIVVGNHDLAYRRDYKTTALEASRLAPSVQLHTDIEQCTWDGRRVLILPFRENQEELTDTVGTIDTAKASETVAFAHLAVNRAITQRHIIDPDSGSRERPITYHGFTGPHHFARLARTFTGHFHSHQVITQKNMTQQTCNDHLRGSVTYIGSPLQLTWADLMDEQRGVILLDPESLRHEFMTNPYAAGFSTADVQHVLEDTVDPATVQQKHVMLIGKLTSFKYITARDKLAALGARSVRSWSPLAPRLQDGEYASSQWLGASIPSSDSQAHHDFNPSRSLTLSSEALPVSSEYTPAANDFPGQLKRFLNSVQLEKSLEERRDVLLKVGQHLLQTSSTLHLDEGDQYGKQRKLPSFRTLFSHVRDQTPTSTAVGAGNRPTSLNLKTRPIFVAKLRSLTITSFLGVQKRLHLDFTRDLRPGLTFLVGENGSGKSTLVEAIVWCQFGRCIRKGLGANDVVNDHNKTNCSVRLEFENGFTITRFRKHKEYGNRVVVEHDGHTQPQFEKADARSTQTAIDELIGVDYETFIRTVVLGHESAASFLSASPLQRRDLIESTLGLEILDTCSNTSRRMLRELDEEMAELISSRNRLVHTIHHSQQRVEQLDSAKDKLEDEASKPSPGSSTAGNPGVIVSREKIDQLIADVQLDVDALVLTSKDAEIRAALAKARSIIQEQQASAQARLDKLQSFLSRMQLQHKTGNTRSTKMFTEEAVSIPVRLLRLFTGLQCRLLFQTRAKLGAGRSPLCRVLCIILQHLRSISMSILEAFARYAKDIPRGSRYGGAVEEESCTDQQQSLASQIILDKLRSDIRTCQQEFRGLDAQLMDNRLIERIAVDFSLSPQDVRARIAQTLPEHAGDLLARIAAALRRQNDLQIQKEHFRHTEALLQQAAAYTQVIKTEQASLQDLSQQQTILESQIANLGTDREFLSFWDSAFAKRSRRVSSSSVSEIQLTFRDFVIKQNLHELDTLMAQILRILFDDKAQANSMTRGVLRFLFYGDDIAPSDTDEVRETVLDSTLGMDPSLGYGKRSGGERKRMDLALFFAILHMGQSRSTHRAHYLLVDEVFDSLDSAGQAAVVRWCDFMASSRVTFILVITHSEHLSATVDASTDEEVGVHRVVLTARMGDSGVELGIDGRRLA